MLAMLLESRGTRCMLSWMRISLGRIGDRGFCFQAPGHRLLDVVNGLIQRIGSSYETRQRAFDRVVVDLVAANFYSASAHPRQQKPGLEAKDSRPQPGH